MSYGYHRANCLVNYNQQKRLDVTKKNFLNLQKFHCLSSMILDSDQCDHHKTKTSMISSLNDMNVLLPSLQAISILANGVMRFPINYWQPPHWIVFVIMHIK